MNTTTYFVSISAALMQRRFFVNISSPLLFYSQQKLPQNGLNSFHLLFIQSAVCQLNHSTMNAQCFTSVFRDHGIRTARSLMAGNQARRQ